jgi:ABC-type transport system substrate-binding protein
MSIEKSVSRREFLVLSVFSAASAAILAACAPAPTEPAAPAAPVGPKVEGKHRELPADAAPLDQQVIRWMIEEQRYIASGIGGYAVMWDVANAFNNNLVEYDNDWNYEPGQAESWEVSEDGTVYTYHLRPGLTWSDGTPLTANDYVTHFKVQLDPENATSVGWFFYDMVNAEAVNHGEMPVDELGIKAIDDLTLEITLKQTTPYWNTLMAYMDSQAYAKHMWDKYGDIYYTAPENSALSGYWKIGEWTKGKELILEARDDYVGAHPGYLQRIELLFGEPTAQFAAYQNDEIDVIADITAPGDIAAIMNDAELSKDHHTFSAWVDWYVLFHTQDGPFKDLNARKAIAHAIDRDAIVNGPLRDAAIPGYTVIPPGFPGNQADNEEIRQIQRFDPDLARKYLSDAGHPNGEGFPPIEIWLRGTGGAIVQQKAAAEALQAMWKDILGLTVEIRPEEPKIYMDNMGSYQIPITLISWGFDFADPIDMVGIPFRSKFPNLGGRLDWVNEEFDKLIDQGAPEANLEKRYKIFQEAEKILLEDCGAVMVWHPISHQLWKPWVKGITENASGVVEWNLTKNELPNIYIGKH